MSYYIKLGHSAAYSVADHQGLAGTVNPHTSVGHQLLYTLCYSTFSMPVIVIELGNWMVTVRGGQYWKCMYYVMKFEQPCHEHCNLTNIFMATLLYLEDCWAHVGVTFFQWQTDLNPVYFVISQPCRYRRPSGPDEFSSSEHEFRLEESFTILLGK